MKSLVKAPPGAPPDDPYYYGWREVTQKGANGRKQVVRVPLTQEDILHPQEGDVSLQNSDHDLDCTYLAVVLRARVGGDPTAVVLHDVRIAWDHPAVKAHCPDVDVLFGVRQIRDWTTFDVAEEGVRPALLIEVTSPRTRNIDFGPKRREYYQVGVPLYVIVEEYSHRGQRRLRIHGYERGPRGYRRLPLNAQGRLWLDPVRLWIGSGGDRVALYDEQGTRVGNYTEVTEALARAEAQAQAGARARAAEALARLTAEQRVRELEEELRRLRGTP